MEVFNMDKYKQSSSLPVLDADFVEKEININEDIISVLTEIEPFKSDSPYYRFTNLTSGELFAKCIENKIVWIKGEGYFYYNGKIFQRDIDNLMVTQYASTFASELLNHAKKYIDEHKDEISDETKKAIISNANKFQGRNIRKNIVEEAKTLLAREASEFDANPNILNCQNCVIDLKEWEVKQHSPEYLCRDITNVDYNPDADGKFFYKFLMEVMDGKRELVEYLKTIIGQVLSGVLYTQYLILLVGISTRNGKTTLLEVIRYLMGSYAVSVSPNSFYVQNRGSSAQNDDVHRMLGKRLIVVGEPKRTAEFDDERIKQFTGKDSFPARTLYKGFVEGSVSGKIILPTNYYHKFDETIYKSRRLIVIPFLKSFSEEEVNENIKDELLEENVKSSILNWMLMGYKRAKDNKWKISIPEEVGKYTELYRTNNLKEKVFMDDVLVKNEGEKEEYKNIFTIYKKWASENKGVPLTYQALKLKLEENGVEFTTNATGKNWVIGYQISEDARAIYEDEEI